MKNLPQVLHQQLKIKFLYIFYIFLLIKVYFLFSIAMDLKQQLFAQAPGNQIAFDLIFIFFILIVTSKYFWSTVMALAV